jgi:hypothetical protein
MRGEGTRRGEGTCGIALVTIALDGISPGNKGTYLGIVCAAGGTWGRGNLGKTELGEDNTWR